MIKLSSRMTFFNKKFFPAIWFGILTIGLILILRSRFTTNEVPLLAAIAPLVLMLFGYFLFSHLCFDLVDEVIDCGDHLLARNRGQEDRIEISNIRSADYQYLAHPPRVSLLLKRPSKFGEVVAFMAPVPWIPFRRSRLIEEFLSRIPRAG